MSKLTKQKKLEILLKHAKEHNITAYEIGKNTKISTYAVQKILNGETKNPNEITVDAILEFIEKAITGTHIKENKVNETPDEYEKTNIDFSKELKECYQNSIEQLKYIGYLKNLLYKNNIEFEEKFV